MSKYQTLEYSSKLLTKTIQQANKEIEKVKANFRDVINNTEGEEQTKVMRLNAELTKAIKKAENGDDSCLKELEKLKTTLL